jgi:hypothetical protein
MWLSPLKGAHLTLGQLDKTLPVDLSVEKNKTIQRGSIVFVTTGKSATGTPSFQLYTSTEAAQANAVPYIALMSVKDFQAGMAGNVGQAPEIDDGLVDKLPAANESKTWLETPPKGATSILGVGAAKGPRITAISLLQPAEFQTTAYDQSTGITYYVGMPLSVNDAGVLTEWTAGKNIVGYVTAVPKSRWINDLGASVDGARISGGNAKVLEFSTAWIPVAAVPKGEDGATVDMLSLKGAKVDAKAGAPAPAAGTKADEPAAGTKGANAPQGK